MKFISYILSQTGRNLLQTWGSQLMTLLTVGLSVLIFSFFLLINTNIIKAGSKLGDDIRLILFLAEEPDPAMTALYRKKITDFYEVKEIKFISRDLAYEKLAAQLGNDRDVLADMNSDFLPPSIEVYPNVDLKSLSQIKLFSEYLAKLPGITKVQYGQEWIERFHYFTELLRVIIILSGVLLVLTTIFMVSYTIKLSVVARQEELKILRLIGATNSYISTPFLVEGFLQGLVGATSGLFALNLLYNWIKQNFNNPGLFDFFEFSFFSTSTTLLILAASVTLCTGGSIAAMRKYLRI